MAPYGAVTGGGLEIPQEETRFAWVYGYALGSIHIVSHRGKQPGVFVSQEIRHAAAIRVATARTTQHKVDLYQRRVILRKRAYVLFTNDRAWVDGKGLKRAKCASRKMK